MKKRMRRLNMVRYAASEAEAEELKEKGFVEDPIRKAAHTAQEGTEESGEEEAAPAEEVQTGEKRHPEKALTGGKQRRRQKRMTATIDWDEMLKKVKLRIGVAGEENDPVLRLMLEDAVTAVTLFCNRDVFPWQLEYVVRHMGERAFERDNGDNVAAIKRGDTQITYGTAISQDDMSQEERDICCKFRRLRVL